MSILSPAVVTLNSFSDSGTVTPAAATSVLTSNSAIAEATTVQEYVVTALEKMSPQDNADILSRLGVA